MPPRNRRVILIRPAWYLPFAGIGLIAMSLMRETAPVKVGLPCHWRAARKRGKKTGQENGKKMRQEKRPVLKTGLLASLIAQPKI
jgi:hypothetical protein